MASAASAPAVLAQLLHRGGIGAPNEWRGCSDAEIARLERLYGIRLVAIYCAFLAR